MNKIQRYKKGIPISPSNLMSNHPEIKLRSNIKFNKESTMPRNWRGRDSQASGSQGQLCKLKGSY